VVILCQYQDNATREAQLRCSIMITRRTNVICFVEVGQGPCQLSKAIDVPRIPRVATGLLTPPRQVVKRPNYLEDQ